MHGCFPSKSVVMAWSFISPHLDAGGRVQVGGGECLSMSSCAFFRLGMFAWARSGAWCGRRGAAALSSAVPRTNRLAGYSDPTVFCEFTPLAAKLNALNLGQVGC
jgi:hypothetical protein